MKLRIGKELLEMMRLAGSSFGLSYGELAARALRRYERQPVDLSTVADPGGGADGTVITIDAPDGMDQATLRRLLWVRLTEELAKPGRLQSKSKAIENKDYILVEDVLKLKLNKEQIDDIIDHLYAKQ